VLGFRRHWFQYVSAGIDGATQQTRRNSDAEGDERRRLWGSRLQKEREPKWGAKAIAEAPRTDDVARRHAEDEAAAQ